MILEQQIAALESALELGKDIKMAGLPLSGSCLGLVGKNRLGQTCEANFSWGVVAAQMHIHDK